MSTFSIEIDARWINGLRQGDAAALEAIYHAFERPVFNLAWRILGDRDEAQELLHDAMLQVIDKIGQYRQQAPFWAWLRQICVNQALMRLRRQRLEYRDEPPEPEASPDWAGVPLEAGDLEAALTRLRPVTRSVIWLYCVEGYTHEEIARAFGRTISFSKTQLARGTSQLRTLLCTDTPQGASAYA